MRGGRDARSGPSRDPATTVPRSSPSDLRGLARPERAARGDRSVGARQACRADRAAGARTRSHRLLAPGVRGSSGGRSGGPRCPHACGAGGAARRSSVPPGRRPGRRSIEQRVTDRPFSGAERQPDPDPVEAGTITDAHGRAEPDCRPSIAKSQARSEDDLHRARGRHALVDRRPVRNDRGSDQGAERAGLIVGHPYRRSPAYPLRPGEVSAAGSGEGLASVLAAATE